MTSPLVGTIARIVLNVRDLDRATAFYVDALDFRVLTRSTDRVTLALGAERIELIHRPDAAAYPEPRAASDPWFQHFAIAVADMSAAYARLLRFSPEPITRGGPQLLPPSTGSVTAYKFRDPDGHPLELSHAPGSAWSRLPAPGAVFLGIDHTALAVRSLEPSIAFYIGLGFRIGGKFLNRGPEQERLDGLDGAVVDIVTLLTRGAGPHLELLHYRSPRRGGPREIGSGDIAATVTMLVPVGAPPGGTADYASLSCLRDPDGHVLRFTA